MPTQLGNEKPARRMVRAKWTTIGGEEINVEFDAETSISIEPMTPVELALEMERDIIRANRVMSQAFLALGEMLHRFDEEDHYKQLIDIDQPGETVRRFDTFDKWLRSKTEISYSKARLALQVHRRLVVQLGISKPLLETVDSSKFADIMPAVEQWMTERVKDGRITSELAALDRGLNESPNLAFMLWQRYAEELCSAASSEGGALSRKDLKEMVGETQGWETVAARWSNVRDHTADGEAVMIELPPDIAASLKKGEAIYVTIRRRTEPESPAAKPPQSRTEQDVSAIE